VGQARCEKGNPAVRWVRKATDLLIEEAELPNGRCTRVEHDRPTARAVLS
jgi:hypothetical protein